MKKTDFNRGWSFTFKGNTNLVELPHDYSISQKRDAKCLSGSGGGFFPGGIADYKKALFVPEEWANKKVFLEFEGVYMNASVRVNNQLAAWHPYGYMSFVCELTPYLRLNYENTISVNVNNNALPNSRWYSGSGIYRPVWLMLSDGVHIAPYGVFVSAPGFTGGPSGEAVLCVSTDIQNTTGAALTLTIRHTVYDAEGKQAALLETARECMAGNTNVVCRANMAGVNVWSIDTPYLYTVKTEIIKENSVIDDVNTRFGFRAVTFDAAAGFALNGVPMNLKGGCVHHDCGLLGAAAFPRAEERKAELLKQSGFNAVRCAHNPPSPAFLDACDRLGMLVIDEAFDVWREEKMPYDYHLYFADWWQRDLTAMILRDRNHPSVILWSTGNEIVERDGRSGGYALARELADYTRKLDGTRKVINALCDLWGTPVLTPDIEPGNSRDVWDVMTADFAAPLDVVGYNYQWRRYTEAAEKYPGRVIIGTETFPKEAYDNWDAVEKLPYVVGDFVWTALDYLGEAGIGHIWYNGENTFSGDYPWNQAYCGDIDICGFKRPQSYYRDFVWGIGTIPYIAVYKPEFYGKKADISAWGWPDAVNCWTWPGYEGKPVEIAVYSGGDEAELFLNGSSLGRKTVGYANRYLAMFETVYTPGELVAVTYKNGQEQYRSVLKTAGEPASIRLSADNAILSAQPNDLSFVTIEIMDHNNELAHQAVNELYITVSGAGSLQAVGNGDPKSEEMYVGAVRRVYYGRAMAVVRTVGVQGSVILNVSAAGLPTAKLELTVR